MIEFNEAVWQKIKELEALYRAGKLDRYRYQDALAHLYGSGAIPYETFSLLNDDAISDAILSLANA